MYGMMAPGKVASVSGAQFADTQKRPQAEPPKVESVQRPELTGNNTQSRPADPPTEGLRSADPPTEGLRSADPPTEGLRSADPPTEVVRATDFKTTDSDIEFDPVTESLVFEVFNKKTGDVVLKIPSEFQLTIRAYLQVQEAGKEPGHAYDRLV